MGCFCWGRCKNWGGLLPSPTATWGLLGRFPRGTIPPANDRCATTPPIRSPISSFLRAILAAGPGVKVFESEMNTDLSWPILKLDMEGLDDSLLTKMDTVRGRRRRTRGAKKRVAREVATALTRDLAVQGAGLGHGAEQPNPPPPTSHCVHFC